ncbi:DMT family transporter [Acidianus sp. HS-5]|uniref:DMT family transporter n=1 Tax=Acidianus sp. HS-5 TaxID=2886040 RepID=UPI001F24E45D|nr:DMT family transporter [Acidianus sp. HS-5]BDC18496.1 EamA family transporter [Acidianus sp. HS-5]
MIKLYYIIPYVVINSLIYTFVKEGLCYASPMFFMALRFLIGGAILLPFARKLTVNKDVILLSVFTTLSTLFWAYGLLYVEPSESAVLSYTMPLIAIPLSVAILKEKTRKSEIIGISIGFLGVILYSLSLGIYFSLLGVTLTLINAIFWALFTVYFRKLKGLDATSVNAVQLLIGSLIFFALSPIQFHFRYSINFLVDLFYVSVLGGGISFYLWNSMLKTERVSKVTVLSFSVPAVSTVVDELRGIDVTSGMIEGIGVMFLGILISRMEKKISKPKVGILR